MPLSGRLLTLTICALGMNAAFAAGASAATQGSGLTVTLPDGTKLAVPSASASTPATPTPTPAGSHASATPAAALPTLPSSSPLPPAPPTPAPAVAAPRVVPATPQPLTGHETPAAPANGQPFGSPAAPTAAPVAKAPAVVTPATPEIQSIAGLPTAVSPQATAAALGVLPSDVPNFFIDSFDVPAFLLPIFQAAGVEYDVPWEVLAAINQVETDYGRNLNVSSAGAEGWMQFLPNTWTEYGVDANGAGVEDPYNPADAIFAAARYLHAAGASQNLRAAIFAYNHADWYVDSVMLRAQLIGGMPPDLVSSITGLTDGLFPVDGVARYTDDVATAAAAASKAATTAAGSAAPVATPAAAQPAATAGQASAGTTAQTGTTAPTATTAAPTATSTTQAGATGAGASTNAPQPIATAARAGVSVTGEAAAPRTPAAQTPPIDIYAKAGAAVVAVKDGVITGIGVSPTLGEYVKLRDASGNTYTYSHLKKLATVYTVPKPPASTAAVTRAVTLPSDPAPKAPASAGHQPANAPSPAPATPATAAPAGAVATDTTAGPQRLFAYPTRPASFAAGGSQQIASALASSKSSTPTTTAGASTPGVEPLRKGSRVTAGTLLGRIGVTGRGDVPHLGFQIRPAGADSPGIDPTPILEGWQLLDAAASYNPASAGQLFGPTAQTSSIDQIALETKAQLEQQVLADPSIVIYAQGRRDIEAGLVDQRVLANLAFLSASNLEPTVSALRRGSSAEGTGLSEAVPLSAQTPATVVDISAINGVAISGHQGTGSITDTAIRQLLTLPSGFEPLQIISLMSYASNPNTVGRSDHADRISLTFAPVDSPQSTAPQLDEGVLTPPQWLDLITRIGAIQNPSVPTKPTTAAIPDPAGP